MGRGREGGLNELYRGGWVGGMYCLVPSSFTRTNIIWSSSGVHFFTHFCFFPSDLYLISLFSSPPPPLVTRGPVNPPPPPPPSNPSCPGGKP